MELSTPEIYANHVLHWNYRGFTEFPLKLLKGEEKAITDMYLKENLISKVPAEILVFEKLESLYLSGNDIDDLPREIGLLKCLKCLDLSGNRLTFLPEEISNVANLKYLILDDNYLRELPLRLAELKRLRYLSVCDNQLSWLAQRPVYNYYHCELRFWRNRDLRCIPYSLWSCMFQDQQIRCLELGCLGTSGHIVGDRCILKLHPHEAERKIEIALPKNYSSIQGCCVETPATLLELSKRYLYSMICRIAKTNEKISKSLYDDRPANCTEYGILDSFEVDHEQLINNNDANVLVQEIKDTDMQNSSTQYTNNQIRNFIVNGNEDTDAVNKTNTSSNIPENIDGNMRKSNNKNALQSLRSRIDDFVEAIKQLNVNMDEGLVEKIRCMCKLKTKPDKKCPTLKNIDLDSPARIVQACFDYLPEHLKTDLRNGPVSRCENVFCKAPIFDNVCLRFCLGTMKLIDKEEEVVLSCAFCSNRCANSWASGRDNLVHYLVEQTL